MEDVIGIEYYKNFLRDDEEEKLINKINEQPWDTRLSRRVQHYGHLYEYNHVDNASAPDVPSLPKWILKLYSKLVDYEIAPCIDTDKLQVIINEYTPGQGIGKHIDDPNKFGAWIIYVSLGSGCEVVFSKGCETRKVYVKRRSVYKMKRDSRYLWSHQIMPKKSDVVNDEKILRDVRLSITFRKIK